MSYLKLNSSGNFEFIIPTNEGMKSIITDHLTASVYIKQKEERNTKMENKWNQYADWELTTESTWSGGTCSCCKEGLHKDYYWSHRAPWDFYQLCPACYQHHVVESNKMVEPSKTVRCQCCPNGIATFELINKDANCSVGWIDKVCEKCLMSNSHEEDRQRYKPITPTQTPNQDEPIIETDKKMETAKLSFDGAGDYVNYSGAHSGKTKTLKSDGVNLFEIETTHSATIQFHNGDIIEIPDPPKNEGWKKEIIFDKWSELDPDDQRPHVTDAGIAVGIFVDCKALNIYEECFGITHQAGCLVLREYVGRIQHRTPKILSLSRWTRTISSETDIAPETYRNPLPPEPPPTNFWIANHEVVYLGQCKEADTYPGADRRLTDKPWSGVWMDKHAPKIEVK